MDIERKEKFICDALKQARSSRRKLGWSLFLVASFFFILLHDLLDAPFCMMLAAPFCAVLATGRYQQVFVKRLTEHGTFSKEQAVCLFQKRTGLYVGQSSARHASSASDTGAVSPSLTTNTDHASSSMYASYH